MSNWNSGNMLNSIFDGSGLHTYYISKKNSNIFNSYNFRYRDNFIQYSSIDVIMKECGGDFIVAYIVF